MIFACTTIALAFAATAATAAVAEQERQCVLAVAGEAAGEPFRAMVAVASAIRNRGCDLRTVYGVRNRVALHASPALLARATAAWRASADTAAAAGCRYFGGPGDAKYFRRIGFRPVLHVGHVTFYRPPRKEAR